MAIAENNMNTIYRVELLARAMKMQSQRCVRREEIIRWFNILQRSTLNVLKVFYPLKSTR